MININKSSYTGRKGRVTYEKKKKKPSQKVTWKKEPHINFYPSPICPIVT